MLTFRTGSLTVAVIVLYAIMKVRGESFAVPRGRWPPLIAASMMNLTVWNIATSFAVLYLPSGHASVLSYTMPLWVALIGFVVFRQPLTGRLLAAILIGAAAVVALMAPNFASYANAPWGLFWGLFAGFCWAVGTFIVKRTSWPGMGLSLTFWQVAASWPPIALGAALIDGLPRTGTSAEVIAVTFYTGAIPMALGTSGLVRTGQAPAGAGRRPLLDRHSDRRGAERRDRPARAPVAAAGRGDRLDRHLALAGADARAVILASAALCAAPFRMNRGVDYPSSKLVTL